MKASNNSMRSIYETLSRDKAAVAESLWVMLQKEQTTYSGCRDYLQSASHSRPSAAAITESDRMQIVDWCYGVVDTLEFDREIVMIAMGLVDRFLSKSSSATRYYLQDQLQFQLLAMAALYIAIKTNELAAFSSANFSAMSGGLYSVEDIEATELKILSSLSWQICAPTSIQIGNHILSLLLPYVNLKEESTWGVLLDEVHYQAEYAVRDYYFSAQRPSTVAFAAIFNALEVVTISQVDRLAILAALMSVISKGDFATSDHLMPATRRLHDLLEYDVIEDDPLDTSARSVDKFLVVNKRGEINCL